MKKVFGILLLIAFTILLTGCRPKDLSGFHESGESWTLYYDDEAYYDVEFLEVNGNIMTLTFTILEGHTDDEVMSFASKHFEIEYNDNQLDEVWAPIIFPFGLYEVPLDSSVITLYITCDVEDFNGMIEMELESMHTSTDPIIYIHMSAY